MPEAAPNSPSQVAEYLTNLGFRNSYNRNQMRSHIADLRDKAEELNETNWLNFYLDCLSVIDASVDEAIAFFDGVDSQLPLANRMMAMELKVVWRATTIPPSKSAENESSQQGNEPSRSGPEKITRSEFDSLSSVPFRHPMAAAMMEEKDWYKSRRTTIAGFIGRDKSDNDYWAMVFGPDPSGKLGWIAGDNDFKTEAEARDRLFEIFSEEEKRGQTVFCHCTNEPCSCGFGAIQPASKEEAQRPPEITLPMEESPKTPGSRRLKAIQIICDSTDLDQAAAASILDASAKGNADRPIQFIKTLRAATNMGLKESKAAVDAARGHNPAAHAQPKESGQDARQSSLNGSQVESSWVISGASGPTKRNVHRTFLGTSTTLPLKFREEELLASDFQFTKDASQSIPIAATADAAHLVKALNNILEEQAHLYSFIVEPSPESPEHFVILRKFVGEQAFAGADKRQETVPLYDGWLRDVQLSHNGVGREMYGDAEAVDHAVGKTVANEIPYVEKVLWCFAGAFVLACGLILLLDWMDN